MLGDWLPADGNTRITKIVTGARPELPPWALQIVDPILVTKLVAPTLQDLLLNFARQLPIPGLGGAAALGVEGVRQGLPPRRQDGGDGGGVEKRIESSRQGAPEARGRRARGQGGEERERRQGTQGAWRSRRARRRRGRGDGDQAQGHRERLQRRRSRRAARGPRAAPHLERRPRAARPDRREGRRPYPRGPRSRAPRVRRFAPPERARVARARRHRAQRAPGTDPSSDRPTRSGPRSTWKERERSGSCSIRPASERRSRRPPERRSPRWPPASSRPTRSASGCGRCWTRAHLNNAVERFREREDWPARVHRPRKSPGFSSGGGWRAGRFSRRGSAREHF